MTDIKFEKPCFITSDFYAKREALDKQFENTNWIEDSGYSYDELKENCAKLEAWLESKGKSHAIIKAKTFEYILNNGQISLDLKDIFSDKLNGRGIIDGLRSRWLKEVYDDYIYEDRKVADLALRSGAYNTIPDFGHTSPNTKALLNLGFSGLIDRLRAAKEKNGELTTEQTDFYDSCEISLNAIISFIHRLAAAVKGQDDKRYICLENIANGKPKNIYEALQLLLIYFFMHEYIGATRVRTLGRLDELLYPFYKNDIAEGRFTKSEIEEMFRYFLNKIWSAKVPFDLPFMLGGSDENGNEITNELSFLIVDIYNELNIHSPKIHIRVSDKTPADFIKKVLECIRGGNSSLLFVNEKVAIKSLEKVGIYKSDAKNFILIGCYEPAVNGVEIGCTGSGSVNMAKAIEFVFTGGKDLKIGRQISLNTKEPESYEEFLLLVKEHIKYMAEKVMEFICKVEKYYYVINPDPILSSMYDNCVESGIDAYNYGAKYNNSSVNFACIASLVDSIVAVKKLVYEEKLLSFGEFREILFSNWEKNLNLRITAKKLMGKYGNSNIEADLIAKELSKFSADLVNNKKNSRGGVFKAGLYSIDRCFKYGEATMATPDGRFAGEPLSKNLSSVAAMDKNGITALINSVTEIDHSDFSNGSVLDVVLHPTAVKGEDGLNAMYGLLKAYFANNGFAMHGNVFDSSVLKSAQKEPEKYSTLQVRLCGWNVYFNNLTKEEQDEFIKQTDNL